MHHKNIKRIIRKQLKNEFPNWKRLTKKEKKEIASKVLTEVVAEYDFKQDIDAPLEELLAIEAQLPAKGIISLDEMGQFISMVNSDKIIKLCNDQRSSSYIKDPELQFIDALIDDGVIIRLLSYDGYSPAMRDLFPSTLFRAELLKAIRYPEISYRKFCTEEYLGLDRKQNRVFMGLPLHKKVMFDHTQLCKFRSSLSFVQQVNLLVYILHHFKQSGRLGECHLHGVDSTELANDCKIPLASLKINGKKVRIYNDVDSDCGARRNKRNKSKYVVGYRLHTLTAIDAETGHSFPLVSLLSPANHHDSLFLSFLIKLAQAMGIDVKLITADEAYHDNDGSIFEETGVIVTTPPSKKVSLPENVDSDSGAVFCHDLCDTPMCHVGFENQIHEYKCEATSSECFHSRTCSQCRFISADNGLFQRIPWQTEQIASANDSRKNCERPFNLLKNQTGLETIRVRSQYTTLARCTLSSIAVLLIEMAGVRRKKKTNKPQQLSLLDKLAA
ncbi:MAG: transposase [Deltaproteobacteria bacterium]|nr:transposase [Deltaproteobacteria bacterium]